MARSCDICIKRALRGKQVTIQWGVSYRSIVQRQPNLHKAKLVVEGKTVQATVCTRCLRSIKNGKYTGISMPDNSAKMETAK